MEHSAAPREVQERPTKRPRRASPPAPSHPLASTSTDPAPSLPSLPMPTYRSIPIHPPHTYTPPGAPATSFQLPLHLTSFSYSPTRQLLLDRPQRDEAISWYTEPTLGSDLNKGYEQCVWREDREDEGLDALLDALDHWIEGDASGSAAEVVGKSTVVTWRGMMTKLMLAVYEAEGASRGRADGWEMNAMVVDGTLYLEESKSPAKIAQKAATESSYKLQSYYGYSFEAYCTTPPSHVPTGSSLPFSPPNTNVQWCSIVKTNLGGFRTILGGEVDCLLPSSRGKSVRTDDFVELKTNIMISNARDEMMFERQKLLKHYVQSFLLGVPLVVVGFRTRPGILTAIQAFKTLEIPRLVRGKPHSWDPLACLASARSLLTFLHSEITSHPSNEAAQACFNDSIPQSGSKTPSSWPVFRIVFVPSGERGAEVSIRELSSQEVQMEVQGGKRAIDRVGMLPERWLEGVRSRRRERERSRVPVAAPVVATPYLSASSVLLQR